MKKALCVKKEFCALDDSMLSHLELVERDVCEKVDSGYIQWIPGLTIIDKNDNVLMYLRSHGSNEERLHSKGSVIFGGHVEREFTGEDFSDFIYFMFEEAVREFKEEVGIDIIERKGTFNIKTDEIYILFPTEDSDPVSSIHAGMVFVCVVDSVQNMFEFFDVDNREINQVYKVNLNNIVDGKTTIGYVEDDYYVSEEVTLEEWGVKVVNKRIENSSLVKIYYV